MNSQQISSRIQIDAKPNKMNLGLDERRQFFKQLLAGTILFSILINIYVLHHYLMGKMDRGMIVASSSVFFLGSIQLILIFSLLRHRMNTHLSEHTEESIKESSKLRHHAHLGKLSAGIFHDLVNRLTALILNVQQIPQDVHLSPKTSDSVNKAINATKRAESFITLLDRHIHFQNSADAFSLNDELEDILTLLTHELRKTGTEPEIRTTEPIWIKGDALIFRQAILSLSFAILHSKHSVFRIEASHKQKHLRISIRYNTRNTPAKAIPASSDFLHAKTLIETSFKGKVMNCGRFDRGSIVLELPSDTIGQAKLPNQTSEHKYDTDRT